MKSYLSLLCGVVTVLALCSSVNAESRQSNFIKIDGSSTVYPITEAVAGDFGAQSKAKITVGISGTGGGFKKFCMGETDISNASRPIKQKEIDLCKTNKVEYVELPIAYDALSVVVNPKNTWAKNITIAELKMLWEPEAQGKITHWNQVRSEWPAKKIYLFGPRVDSGTFDYFTEVVTGKSGASRGDFTSSEDDNVLVQGIATNKYALGFFGMAYYVENRSKLKALGIDDEDSSNGAGPQLPSMDNVVQGVYQPLARPLFLYSSKTSLTQRPIVMKFVQYYLDNVDTLSTEVGYIRSPSEVKKLTVARFEKLVTGTIFASNKDQNLTLVQLMTQES